MLPLKKLYAKPTLLLVLLTTLSSLAFAQPGLEPGMTVKANKNIRFLCEGDTVLVLNNFQDTAGIYSHFIFNFNAQSNSQYHSVTDTVYNWDSRYHVYQFHDSVSFQNCNKDSIVMEVSLTGYDTTGLDYKITTNVTIFLKPRARISVPNGVCVGDKVSLRNQSCPSVGSGRSYLWDIDGKKYNTFEPDSVTFSSAGTYDVKLRYSMNSHCVYADSTKGRITIIDRPVPDLDIVSNGAITSRDTFCVGDTILFLDKSQNSSSHTFKFTPSSLGTYANGSRSNSDTVYYRVSRTGTLTYSIEARNSGCSDESGTKQLHFVNNPNIQLKTLPSCLDDSVIDLNAYIDSSNGVPPKVTWRISGNGLDTIITAVAPGTIRRLKYGRYKVQVASEGGCKSILDSSSFFVSPKVSILPGDTFCYGLDTLVNVNKYLTKKPGAFRPKWSGNVTNDSFFDVKTASIGNHRLYLSDQLSTCYSEQITVRIVGPTTTPLSDVSLCGKTSSFIPLDSLMSTDYEGDYVQSDTFQILPAGLGDHKVYYTTRNDGCTFKDSFLIKISGGVSNNIGSTSPGCVGVPISFTQQGNATSAWSFGDGQTSSSTNPQHSYSSAGTYYIELITENICNDTFRDTVLVFAPPNSFFQVVLDSSECDSVHVLATYSNLDSTMTSKIAMGTSTYDTSRVQMKFTRDLYAYDLHIVAETTNRCGRSDSVVIVEIPALHRAQIGIIGLNPGCSGDTLKLVDQSVGSFDSTRTYYGDRTSSKDVVLNKPFFNNTDSVVTFQVVHHVYSNVCGLLSDTVDYQLLPNYVQAAAEHDKDLVCPNEPVQFINNSTQGTSFILYFDDGGSASGSQHRQVLSHAYSASGVYRPYIIAWNRCGRDTTWLDSIVIKELPKLQLLSSDERVCLGSSFTLRYEPDSLVSPRWFVNSVQRDSFKVPFIFEPVTAGNYWVRVEAIAQSCLLKDSLELVVEDVEPVDFSIQNPIVCDTVFVQLDISDPEAQYDIDWGDGTPLTKSLKHFYANTGQFTITCRVISGHCSHLFEQVVERISRPRFETIFDSCLTQGNPFYLRIVNLPDSIAFDINYWADGEELSSFQNQREISHLFEPKCKGNTFSVDVGRLGCVSSFSLDHKQISWCLSDSASQTLFVMPNAFSPNSDDINDTFGPIWIYDVNSLDFRDSFEFVIYDRWGGMIFHTDNPKTLWNGYVENQVSENDVSEYYLYTIRSNTNCLVNTPRRSGMFFMTK
ncbi:MAG: PKD domain-containing protein [Bacteroidia bacterium]|nr:PKD domain-containing protein [Bacteroidia bacterium]